MSEKAAPPPRERGRLVATYVYLDAEGAVVGECRRFELPPVEGKAKPGKRFSWRYQGPSGGWVYRCPAEVPLYRLPSVLATAGVGGQVWVVEGERNADDLTAAGVIATTAPNGARRGWRAEYTAALAGAAVTVVADRDASGYAHAAEVARALEGIAASVRVVRTPLEQSGADISDHLAAGLGLAQVEPVPAGELDGGDVVPFPTRPSGDPDEEGRGGGGGGHHRRPRVRDRYGTDDGSAVVEPDAHVRRLAMVQIKEIDGQDQLIELLDCKVRIVRRIAVDPGDGSPVGTTHLDLIAERDGESIKLERVSWDEFRKCAYLHRLPWDLTWKDTPLGRSTLANAITATSGPVPVVMAYGTLGWREVTPGEWAYVHAAGAIGATGAVAGVEVDVAPRLAGFTMPPPPATAAELRAALEGVLAVLDRLPARIAAPVMGAPLRAMLGDTRASVFILGHTGTRKSGVAALAQQVHCPSARHNRLPVGAGEAATTVTAMEELLWQAADSLLVADDLAPDRGAERSAARANELLRMVGNATCKARGARMGGLRVDRPPRALLMLTGEDGASRPSAESRTVYVPLTPGDVPLEVIRGLSTRELIAARNTTGAALARYVAGRMPITEWVDDQRDTYSAALLAAETDPDGLASRRADAVAELAVGWRALLDAALAGGALDETTAQGVWARVWMGLVECLARQTEVTEHRCLVERAADLLRSAIRAGRAHLQAPDGGAPQGTLAPCGWTRGEGPFPDLRASGESVGWTNGTQVWLDPGVAFSVMERQARAESDPLAVTPRALTTALLGAGVLSTERVSGRASPAPQVRRRVGGARQRVWELPWSWLWPDDTTPDTDPTTTPTPEPDTPPTPPPPAGPTPPPPNPAPETVPEMAPEMVPEPPTQSPSSHQGPEAPAASDTGALSTAAPGPTRYRAAGVVVDVGQAHLIGGDGPVELPEGVESLPELLEWATGLHLGTAHRRSRDDAGQIWIMPGLAVRLGLHKAPEKGSTRATSSHPVAKALSAAGWELGNRGVQAWTHLWRPGEPGIHVVIVPWLTEDAICNPAAPPSARDLAERLDLYATMVGTPAGEHQPFLYSAASTGTALLRLIRATAREPLTVVDPPPPAAEGGGRRWEPEWSWQRGPTRTERDRLFVVAWDVNAQYLAAAGATTLGLGQPRHVEAPALEGPRSKLPPGYWRLHRPEGSGTQLLPDLLNPAPTDHTDPEVWVTTPTVVAALEHGQLLEPVEAWVWDRRTDWLEDWAHALRDARYALDTAGAEHDPELRVVLRAVKLTYAGGIGMLGSEKWRAGKPEYRPDARHHVIATAKANLYRKCATAAAAGWAPLAIERDTVLFASDSPNPNQTPPPGFTLGRKLGAVTWYGAAPMADLADALAASPRPGPDTIGRLRTQ